jgi:hypothetical protein
MAVKTAPTLATVHGLLDEVDEYYRRVRKIRLRLGRLRRGSEPYLDLLPDLWVEAGVLKDKADFAAEFIEKYQEWSWRSNPPQPSF